VRSELVQGRTNLYSIGGGRNESDYWWNTSAATADRTDRKLCSVVQFTILAGKTVEDPAWPRLPAWVSALRCCAPRWTRNSGVRDFTVHDSSLSIRIQFSMAWPCAASVIITPGRFVFHLFLGAMPFSTRQRLALTSGGAREDIRLISTSVGSGR